MATQTLSPGMKFYTLVPTLFEGYILEQGACGEIRAIEGNDCEVAFDSIYLMDREHPNHNASVKMTKSDLKQLQAINGIEVVLANIA